MAQFDLKRASVKIKDGTGTPNTITVKVGEGTLTYSEKRNIEYQRNRGLLDTCREGDEEPVEVKLDYTWEYVRTGTVTGYSDVTVEDAIKNINGASAWLSSDTVDPCAPYAVNIVIEYIPLCSGTSVSGTKETITLSNFRWESVEHNAKEGTCSISGKCNITKATAVRS